MSLLRSLRSYPVTLAAIGLLASPVTPAVFTIPWLAELLASSPAQAESTEAVAKEAQAITVRLEGATQGSGVLVKKEGNRYTVLTAWHVVSGQRPGEELAIITPDGKQHQLDQGSIQRLENVDLALLSFSSSNSLSVARIGDPRRLAMGGAIYVAGFPLGTSAVPARILRFLDGRVIANAQVAIPNGYQLLYSNQTQRGMSGGPVLDGSGQLVGIHGQAETDTLPTADAGVSVKTGTSQGVPISYYRPSAAAITSTQPAREAPSADDFLALAKQLLGQKGREQEVIRLASQSLALQANEDGYFYRAYAKLDLADYKGAIADYGQLLVINPHRASAYHNRGNAKFKIGDLKGAAADYSRALTLNPKLAWSYFARGQARFHLGDKQGAIVDFDEALANNLESAEVYFNRGAVKDSQGDKQGAIADYSQALAINPQYVDALVNRGAAKNSLGDNQGAIADYSQALAINPVDADSYTNRGIAKSALGDNQGALADYNQALSVNPRDANAYYNRGVLRYLLADQHGAIDDFSKALDVNPRDARSYFNRGAARFNMGSKEKACADMQQSSALGELRAARFFQEKCQ